MTLPLAIPNVDDYEDWKSYARALQNYLFSTTQGEAGFQQYIYHQLTNIDPDWMPSMPAGFQPIWMDTASARLWLANPEFDPPTAPDIVFIDTQAIADAAIEANKVANLAIETRSLLDSAVTTLKIGAAAVEDAKIAVGAVTNTKLADLSVTTAKVVDGTIVTAKIGDLAVVTAKIGDAAVTSLKVQDAAIISAKIADAAILSAKIFDLAVVTGKIADAAIVTAKIGDLQVVTAKIDNLAVNDAKLANLAVTSAKIANLAVGSAHIQLLAVTAALIADGAVTNLKIGDVIQSGSWNETTKQGWKIDKTGNIYGSGINIYDGSGSLIFGSGSSWQLDFARIIGTTRPAPNAGTTLTLVSNSGDLEMVGNQVRRHTGEGWDRGFNSVESFLSGTVLTWVHGAHGYRYMIGFTDVPITDSNPNYTQLDFGVFMHESGFDVYRDGVPQSIGGVTAAVGDVMALVYNNLDVRLYRTNAGSTSQVGPTFTTTSNRRFLVGGAMYHTAPAGTFPIKGLKLDPYSNQNFGDMGGLTRPADYADATTPMLSLGTGTFTKRGNSITKLTVDSLFDLAMRGPAHKGPQTASMNIVPGSAYTMIGFDTNAANFTRGDSKFMLQYHAASGGWELYVNGSFVEGAAGVPNLVGKAAVTYDEVRYRAYVGGVKIGADVAAAPGLTLYAKLYAYLATTYDGFDAVPIASSDYLAEQGGTTITAMVALGLANLLGQITTSNNTTFIGSAAIIQALIANLAVGTAQIADLAVVNAKIADATIASAKIISLVANKIVTGLLQNPGGTVVFDVDTGIWRAVAGSYRMMRGSGFGTSSNLIEWYGLNSVTLGTETIANSLWAVATDGKLYHGGAALAASNPVIELSGQSNPGDTGVEVAIDSQAGIPVAAGGKFRILASASDPINIPGITHTHTIWIRVNYGAGDGTIASASVTIDASGEITANSLPEITGMLFTNPSSGTATFSIKSSHEAGAAGANAIVDISVQIERVITA